MPSTKSNIITTTLLTLTCALVLFLSYRHAIRPILNRYNIPLQSLPSLLTNRSRGWMNSRGPSYRPLDPDAEGDNYDSDNDEIDGSAIGNNNRRPGAGGRRLSRDLEEGFRDSDSEEEGQAGDERLGAETNGGLRQLPPTPVLDDVRDFPRGRI